MLRRVPWASWLAPSLPLENHPWKEWWSDRDKDALASGLVLECCFWDRQLQGIPIGVRAFGGSLLGFKWLDQQWACLTCPEQGWPPGGAISSGMQIGSLRLDLGWCQQGGGQRRWVRLQTPLPLTLRPGAGLGGGGQAGWSRRCAIRDRTSSYPTRPGPFLSHCRTCLPLHQGAAGLVSFLAANLERWKL